MIDGKIFLGAAVLAFVVIALENILAGKINALVGGVHIWVQSDHRWHAKRLRDGMQLVSICWPDKLALLKVNQNKSTLYRANHQWAKILIQYQNPTVHL